MKTTVKSITKVFIFEDENGCEVLVKNFKDGFVEIDIPISINYDGNVITLRVQEELQLIRFISGCFKEDSNFKQQLFSIYGCDPSTKFNGFKLSIMESSCTIKKENSSRYRIEDAIKALVDTFLQKTTEEINRKKDENNRKIEIFTNFLDKLDVEFKSYQKEEEYENAIEGKEEDFLYHGETFVAYTQYLIEEIGYNVDEATNKCYERITSTFGKIEDSLDSIRFICQFCKYGEDIYESYSKIIIDEINDELDYL